MNEKKTVALQELYPIIKEKLDCGGTVMLPITGTSMRPLLVWGRDSVEITKCDSYKKGDIIFYRRDDGHFVLHRIVDITKKGYVLCGDNQTTKEFGICDRHIIGVVINITRKGKTFSVNKLSYKVYWKFWTSILPYRSYIGKIIKKLKGLFK